MGDFSKLNDYKNVILDFDGTLASLVMDWGEWFDGMTSIYLKYEPSGEFVGKNFFLIQNDYVRKHGRILRDEIASFVSKYEERNIIGFEPNDELVKYVKDCPDKTYYVLSSQSRGGVLRGLKDLQIDNQITKVVSRDDVVFIKPDPEGIHKIISGLATRDFILLGDSDVDIQTAESVGIASMRVQM